MSPQLRRLCKFGRLSAALAPANPRCGCETAHPLFLFCQALVMLSVLLNSWSGSETLERLPNSWSGTHSNLKEFS